MFVCKHCLKQFSDLTVSQKANHSRWCDQNPKRESYLNKGVVPKQFATDAARLKRNESVKRAHAEGRYTYAPAKTAQTRKVRDNAKHTQASKDKISAKALASGHRRLLRSTRSYVKKDSTHVMLDSSWEEALANRLDELSIEWVRPDQPIKYKIDGKVRSYFPDFYLPEHDIFLDPKNPAAMLAQKDKIEALRELLPNLVILHTLEECKGFKPQ